jgi:hypothetical protein
MTERWNYRKQSSLGPAFVRRPADDRSGPNAPRELRNRLPENHYKQEEAKAAQEYRIESLASDKDIAREHWNVHEASVAVYLDSYSKYVK